MFILSRGLLTTGDVVALAPGLHVQGNVLLDDASGARHRLHPHAIHGLLALQRGLPAAVWLARSRLEPGEAAEVISFLNSMGGLQVRRSLWSNCRLWLTRLHSGTLGFKPAQRTRRFSADALGIICASSLALAPVIVCLLVVALVWPVAVTIVITLWASVIAHEFAHHLVVMRHSRQAIVLQRGLNLGLLHPPLPAGDDRVSALAGPIAGAVLALAIATGPIGLLVAMLHLASLLPLSGDGRAVWRMPRSIRP